MLIEYIYTNCKLATSRSTISGSEHTVSEWIKSGYYVIIYLFTRVCRDIHSTGIRCARDKLIFDTSHYTKSIIYRVSLCTYICRGRYNTTFNHIFLPLEIVYVYGYFLMFSDSLRNRIVFFARSNHNYWCTLYSTRKWQRLTI